MSNDPLRQKVQELQAVPDRTLAQAGDLSQAQTRLAIGEWEEKHPLQATALGALSGGTLMGSMAPALAHAGKSHASHFREELKDLGRILRPQQSA
jgi:hypothetical protein